MPIHCHIEYLTGCRLAWATWSPHFPSCSLQATAIQTDISDTPVVRASIDGPISAVAVSVPVLMSAAVPTTTVTTAPTDDRDGSVGASSQDAASGDVGLAIGLTVLVMLIVGAGVGGVLYVRFRGRPASGTSTDLASTTTGAGDAAPSPLHLVTNPSYSPAISAPCNDDKVATDSSASPADV